MLLAALIAVVAGVLIFVFVDSRSTGGGIVGVGGGSTRVLVAKALIPKGSSGDIVAAQQMTAATSLDGGQVKDGALSDPAVLAGQVATADIYPGQQITAADFSAATGTVVGKLTGDKRAVAVPVDASHGVGGNVTVGDHVDVYASIDGGNGPTIKPLVQNSLVLAAPAAGTQASTVVLRADSGIAAKLAWTADNGRIWLVLRPPVGSKAAPPTSVTLDSLLAQAGTVPSDGPEDGR